MIPPHPDDSFTLSQPKYSDSTQLITYANRFGKDLSELASLMTELRDAFDGVHILPFFTPFDGADAGFDPSDHTSVDPRLGSWDDVKKISQDFSVMADMIVNHMSYKSAQFQDVVEKGQGSPYADMFLTLSSVFPEGASEQDLAAIYRPRPGLPFTHYKWGEQTRLVWTTFTPQQIDVDMRSEGGRRYIASILSAMAAGGVSQVRLDAVGYSVKTAGSSCFMTPQTYEFIGELTEQARALGMSVLVEIHSHYKNQIQVAQKVDSVYDFALPPLVLHALYTGQVGPLTKWLKVRPTNAITVLDTHDGIGIVDVGPDQQSGEAGLLSAEAVDGLVEGIHEASKGASRKATGWNASNLDIYQVNCTFFDACGADEDAYFLARAVQAFTPGVCQVYYAGLLAAPCDLELLAQTGVGRDINRPYYSAAQVREELRSPVVRRILGLLQLRKSHPAFKGKCQVRSYEQDSRLVLTWENKDDWAELVADFAEKKAEVTYN
ncbi:sucrose phosphorylase [Winkia sp. UMB3158]|uniref:Sucrose phosphorylase n=2 Tax=Winkia neuii TaxID=33007 RepID=K0YRZ3_9ACTO|nr:MULTISPECIES: sucrose phosphorylase [Winkia]MDK8342334.1 sucrose phosphorylase [Winkia sp. UMB3164B]OFT39059.1 sucrose phosphorylase [Actinomyces sp. HMSC08A01]EJZ86542.1 sucrose phosphorylase [Winkia neuii BV029A5]MBS5946753.1 sucrose phosphorylase [Winkia neuii]MCG7303313.1 sucrose phosphorylase [Winkia sp. ACRQY]